MTHIQKTPHLRHIKEHCRREGIKNVRAKIKEISVRLCLLVLSEATPIKSQQHDCSNVSSTMMTLMDMPNQARNA